MSKMAKILQEENPGLEVLALHAEQRLHVPKTLAVPKTLKLPPEAYNPDGTLHRFMQRQWFKTGGPFHSWRGRVIHTAGKVQSFIRKQVQSRGLSLSDVALCGFSQGGAVAMYTAYLMKEPIGAVISHSAPFLSRARFKSFPPTLFIYGTPDQSISDSLYKRSVEHLLSTNREAEICHIPNLGHRMSTESCLVCADFIKEHLYEK